MKVAIVHNARSTRNRAGLVEIKAALAPLSDAVSFDFDAHTSLEAIAGEIAGQLGLGRTGFE